MESLEERVTRLERKLTSQSRRERLLGAVLFLSVATLVGGAIADPADEELTLRRLTIVDEAGTPRVMIGSPLPDPPILGRRAPRGQTGHGVLLFDASGTERGGYVTFDESDSVMLTLDNTAHMAAQFAAGPVGGARLMMRDDAGADIRLGAWAEGPYVRLARGDAERSLTLAGVSPDAP